LDFVVHVVPTFGENS